MECGCINYLMTKRSLIVVVCGLALALIAAGTLLKWQSSTDEAPPGEREERAPVPEGKRLYIQPAFRFSLILPEEMEVEAVQESGGAHTLTFTLSDSSQSFQIYSLPYKNETITSSRIAKDTHGTAKGEPAEVVLGGGVRGLMFESENPALGRLLEVWFIHNGRLFEVTTSIDNQPWLAEILNTFDPDAFE